MMGVTVSCMVPATCVILAEMSAPNRAVQVASIPDMYQALNTGGEYIFLGCLGWFSMGSTATAGVYPSPKGCVAMKSLHFDGKEAEMPMFPVQLRVSVPAGASATELEDFFNKRNWQADNGDIFRFAFMMMVVEVAQKPESGRQLALLRKCANNILVPSPPMLAMEVSCCHPHACWTCRRLVKGSHWGMPRKPKGCVSWFHRYASIVKPGEKLGG